MKTCSKCKEVKPKGEFYPRPERPCGVTSSCIKCQRKKARVWQQANPSRYQQAKQKWNAANPDNVKKWEIDRKLRKYELTIAQFNALLQAQHGMCAICGDALKIAGRGGLAIDHAHGTNPVLVRGMLCTPCNTALGGFRDSSKLLLSAVEYLRKADPLPAGLMPCH